MSRRSCWIVIALFSLTLVDSLELIADSPRVVDQSFDQDPLWEGFRNRLLPDPLPFARQDFGYRRSNFANGIRPGEIGGTIQRAERRAYYAKRIPKKTLNDVLSASGTFAINRADGGSGVLIGWFNDQRSSGWRTPDSLAIRIDGNDGKYWIFYEYGTTGRATGGGGAFQGERYQTTVTAPFLADGTGHRWSLTYDPNAGEGRGLIQLQVDDRRYKLPLHSGHRERGALFDRFGIWTQQVSGGSMDVYFDDLTIDGSLESFDVDPKWTATGNEDSYEQQIIRPFQDFGFNVSDHAGGEVGEIGGIIFRDEAPSYFADQVGPFDLDSPLQASGTLTLRSAGADSGVMLGWFNREKKRSKSIPEDRQPLTDYLGIYLEGPSRAGHFFRAAYSTSRGNRHAPTDEGTASERPIVVPSETVHHWSMHYDPHAVEGRGRVTVKFDNRVHELELAANARSDGASFDRFGLFNVQSGGHHVEIYLDDLSYSK